VSLSDPELVREEYASERGLEARRSLYDTRIGPDPREVLWAEIVRAAPTRVLEVGSGPGEISERIQRVLGASVVAIDISPRMVELARGRGVDAHVGDAQHLPFTDAEFELVVAAWVLFHLADLDRGLAELARVLKPGRRLLAVTNSEHHLAEMRAHAGFSMVGHMTFSRENGEEALLRHFARVERIDVDGSVTFEDASVIRAYLRSTVTRKRAADAVPDLTGPLLATTRNTVFAAEKAA
jgi:SAM-dependent methyltransferase